MLAPINIDAGKVARVGFSDSLETGIMHRYLRRECDYLYYRKSP